MAKNMREKTARIAENKDRRPRAVAKHVRISPYKVSPLEYKFPTGLLFYNCLGITAKRTKSSSPSFIRQCD